MSCTSVEQSQQVLEAMSWYFGARHCRSTTFADDNTGDQSGLYFDLNVIDENYEEKQYYVLLSDGTAVDPAPAGKTKIEVVFAQDDTADVIAGLYVTALALIEVNAEATGAIVEVENKFLGLISVEDYSNASGIIEAINTSGFGGTLGAVAQGGGTLNTEQSLQDIVSDQTGDIVLDQIIRGSTLSLDLTIAEMTTEKWESLIGNGYGDIKEENSEKLTGYGTSKLYKSSFNYAGQLVGHPIRLPSTNRNEDIVIWKTVGNLNSINYSGTDVQGGEMTFTGLRDASKPSEIDLFARGDHSLV